MREILTGLASLAAAVSNVAPAAAPSPPDMELGSPASPESPRSPDPEDGDDLFEPPRPPSGGGGGALSPWESSPPAGRPRFDDLFRSEPGRVVSRQRQKHGKKHKEVPVRRGEITCKWKTRRVLGLYRS